MGKKLKASSISPANIAFIKYWGKKDKKLRIPLNSSISMNLSHVYTHTTVEFAKNFKEDTFKLLNEKTSSMEEKRVFDHINIIKSKALINLKAKIVSVNNFPKSTGLSSSASGFSALTMATVEAAGLNLNKKELSQLARLGSGSACRSIPDGFVKWQAGDSHKNSYAYSLFSPKYWKLYDVIAIVSKQKKLTSSTKGQELIKTSPFFKKRLKSVNNNLKLLSHYLKKKDFTNFGILCEQEALNMHAVMITSWPSLLYWTPNTLKLIKLIKKWRQNNLEAYFTINTGQDVHILVEEANLEKLSSKLKQLKFVKKIIINKPTIGVRTTEKHLF
ncbi:diphosphomevalonate decarboxylase [Patescibacteria group bacterium]